MVFAVDVVASVVSVDVASVDSSDNGQKVVYTVVSSLTTLLARDSKPVTNEHLLSEQLVTVMVVFLYCVLVTPPASGVDVVIKPVVDVSMCEEDDTSDVGDTVSIVDDVSNKEFVLGFVMVAER